MRKNRKYLAILGLGHSFAQTSEKPATFSYETSDIKESFAPEDFNPKQVRARKGDRARKRKESNSKINFKKRK